MHLLNIRINGFSPLCCFWKGAYMCIYLCVSIIHVFVYICVYIYTWAHFLGSATLTQLSKLVAIIALNSSVWIDEAMPYIAMVQFAVLKCLPHLDWWNGWNPNKVHWNMLMSVITWRICCVFVVACPLTFNKCSVPRHAQTRIEKNLFFLSGSVRYINPVRCDKRFRFSWWSETSVKLATTLWPKASDFLETKSKTRLIKQFLVTDWWLTGCKLWKWPATSRRLLGAAASATSLRLKWSPIFGGHKRPQL